MMMMMCVMPMNYITCSCEDSQMDMSSVRETGLPAHNDQNACLFFMTPEMSFKQVVIPAFFFHTKKKLNGR